jgi:GT2 family glycosyltransferase
MVVDNASADASADVASAHEGVEVIRNPKNVGYARAMNQALAVPGADVLIALNPDTEPPPDSLACLVRRLLEQPEVGLVGPRLANLDGSLQHSAYRFPSIRLALVVGLVPARLRRGRLGRRFWLESAAPHDQTSEVDWLIGAVHVMRAQAVDAARPYSERWFMYVEDLDLCWRLAELGWSRKLEADVVIPHVGRASADQAWDGNPMKRWMPPSYDWYAEAYGPLAMRVWALVNAASLANRFAVAIAIGFAGRGDGRKQARARARDLAWQLRLHVGAILRRPPVPDLPPRSGLAQGAGPRVI